MGDGHETASAVERLPAKWRALKRTIIPGEGLARALLRSCIDDLTRALEEDGVIPTRK